MIRRPPRSTLFPYTTLFRSERRLDHSHPVGLPVSIPEIDPGRLDRAPQIVSQQDRKSTRLNSSHGYISYAVFCLKKKKKTSIMMMTDDLMDRTSIHAER